MTGVWVLLLCFALGCITGVVVHALQRHRRAKDAPGTLKSHTLRADT